MCAHIGKSRQKPSPRAVSVPPQPAARTRNAAEWVLEVAAHKKTVSIHNTSCLQWIAADSLSFSEVARELPPSRAESQVGWEPSGDQQSVLLSHPCAAGHLHWWQDERVFAHQPQISPGEGGKGSPEREGKGFSQAIPGCDQQDGEEVLRPVFIYIWSC